MICAIQKNFRRAMAVIMVLAAPAALQAASAPLPGIWANPSNSVHVAFRPCGGALCGKVIWADGKARADAERGGTTRLVGAMLFRDFQPSGPGRWDGAVLVPDLGRSLKGSLELVDARTLRGKGCILPGIGCKAQTWTRIG
jgi:uncharacterized protein (DUF2147 family)